MGSVGPDTMEWTGLYFRAVVRLVPGCALKSGVAHNLSLPMRVCPSAATPAVLVIPDAKTDTPPRRTGQGAMTASLQGATQRSSSATASCAVPSGQETRGRVQADVGCVHVTQEALALGTGEVFGLRSGRGLLL